MMKQLDMKVRHKSHFVKFCPFLSHNFFFLLRSRSLFALGGDDGVS